MRNAWLTLVGFFVAVASAPSFAADYRTANFIVSARSASFARQVALAAESTRKEQAEQWLGGPLPRWTAPCPIKVFAGENYHAQGSTSFVFRRREARSWRMTVEGTEQDILESVLPHEVMHTILATYFGEALPRWADEGVGVMAEPATTQQRFRERLVRDAQRQRIISVERLLVVKEYPDHIMRFYSHGFSLTQFLVEAGGKHKFIQFLRDGLRADDWLAAIRRHYGYQDYGQLSTAWLRFTLSDSQPPVQESTSLSSLSRR